MLDAPVTVHGRRPLTCLKFNVKFLPRYILNPYLFSDCAPVPGIASSSGVRWPIVSHATQSSCAPSIIRVHLGVTYYSPIRGRRLTYRRRMTLIKLREITKVTVIHHDCLSVSHNDRYLARMYECTHLFVHVC